MSNNTSREAEIEALRSRIDADVPGCPCPPCRAIRPPRPIGPCNVRVDENGNAYAMSRTCTCGSCTTARAQERPGWFARLIGLVR